MQQKTLSLMQFQKRFGTEKACRKQLFHLRSMGHKIRKAMGDRDAFYKLAGLLEMDDTYFGPPKPGKQGRDAFGKAKVVVAVETPAEKNKPRFAAMHMVPRVSRAEIQPLVRERLATEAVIKTDGWQGYCFLDAAPGLQHEWLVPGSGKEAPKVLPWVHTLIANIKGNSGVSTMGSVPSICLATWRSSATVSTAASGNPKCLIGCFMPASIQLPSLSRS